MKRWNGWSVIYPHDLKAVPKTVYAFIDEVRNAEQDFEPADFCPTWEGAVRLAVDFLKERRDEVLADLATEWSAADSRQLDIAEAGLRLCEAAKHRPPARPQLGGWYWVARRGRTTE
jgi:hypothetical protein